MENNRPDIQKKLEKYYTPEEAGKWLDIPHPQLDGRTPAWEIKNGRIADVCAIIDRLESAVYL